MSHYPLITVVGGSGFVGRHLVKLLAACGYRVRVLVRDTVAAEFLKTCATVGQISIEHVDITRPETLAGKFDGSYAVVNLVSILYQSGRQKFEAINVAGARAIAAEAKRAGVVSLVHISAAGIEQAATTAYGRTKLAGEKAIREEFPEATILRPSLIIGPEDGFFQRFGRMSMISPALPLIRGGKTKFQPILVTDVAQAVIAAFSMGNARGEIFELGGPLTYNFRELLEMMARVTKRKPRLVWVPACVAWWLGLACELVPFFPPMITRDQVKLLKYDNVVKNGARTMTNLGITPNSIESALPYYLSRFVKD